MPALAAARKTLSLTTVLSGLFAQISTRSSSRIPVNYADTPLLSNFSRSSEAYALDLNFESKVYAANTPRVNRKGLFVSDQSIPANLIVAPINPTTTATTGGETVALTAGVHTLQMHGRGSIEVKDPSGVVVVSTDGKRATAVPGDHLTFNVPVDGSYVLRYEGRPSLVCLRKWPHPEQFSIGPVEPEVAEISLNEGNDRGLYIEGQMRHIGRTQEIVCAWADGSRLEIQRGVDGRIRLSATVDGTTVNSTWSGPFAGTGAAFVLRHRGTSVFLHLNGVQIATLQMPRLITGACTLRAHAWRSYFHKVEVFTVADHALDRLMDPAVYKLTAITPRNLGDNVERVRSNFSQTTVSVKCVTADTFEMAVQWSARADLTNTRVGSLIKFAYWTGGLVGGKDIVGKSFAIKDHLTSPNRVRFVADAAAFNDGTSVGCVPETAPDGRTEPFGDLVTIATGFQANRLEAMDMHSMSNGDKITFDRVKYGSLPDFTDIAGKEFTMNSAGYLAASGWTSPGLVRIWYQRHSATIRRAGGTGSAYLPAIWDLDRYIDATEKLYLAGYDATNRKVRDPGAFTMPAQTMSDALGNAPPSSTPSIIVGRTTEVSAQVLKVRGTSGSFIKGASLFIGGAYNADGGMSCNGTTGDIVVEGVTFDRRAFGELSGGDITYVVPSYKAGPEYRICYHASNFLNKGGLVTGTHSDSIQLNNTEENPPFAIFATAMLFTGNYQNLGQFAPQQLPRNAGTPQVAWSEIRRDQPIAMLYLEDAEVINPPGNDVAGGIIWYSDGVVLGGFAQNGNRPVVKQMRNIWNYTPAALDANTTYNTLAKIPDLADNASGVPARWRTFVTNKFVTIAKAFAMYGGWNIGRFPGKLRRDLEDTVGGLGLPGMKYQSMQAPLFDGYGAGLQQIPREFRRSAPVEFEWQQTKMVNGVAQFMFVDPDWIDNPFVTLDIYRSKIPAGVLPAIAAGSIPSEDAADTVAAAYKIPEDFNQFSTVPTVQKIATLTALPNADVHYTDNGVAAGEGAYYRLVTTRANGEKTVSTMLGLHVYLVTVSTNAVIVADGDSTVAGQKPGGGNTQATDSWPSKLSDLIAAAGYSVSDDGLFGDHGSWGTAQSIVNFAAGDGRFAYSGAFSLSAAKVAGGNGFYANAAGNMVFTPRRPVRKYDIYWLDQTGTGRTWNASAGTSGTVALTTTGVAQLVKTTIDCGSVGLHALTVAWAAGGGSHLLAVVGYNDTSGAPMRVLNWGICGADSAKMIDDASTPISRKAQAGYYAADLTIIEGGVNDWRQNVDVATFKANITTRVQTAKAGKTGAKALLLTPVYDPSTTGNSANQELYVTAMKEIATEQGVPVFDIRPLWQSHAYAVSQGWAVQGDVHPTAAGYAKIAQWVRAAINIV